MGEKNMGNLQPREPVANGIPFGMGDGDATTNEL